MIGQEIGNIDIGFDLAGKRGVAPDLDDIAQHAHSSLPESDVHASDVDVFAIDLDEMQALDKKDSMPSRPSESLPASCSSSLGVQIGGSLERAKTQARLRQRRLRIPTLIGGGLFLTIGFLMLIIRLKEGPKPMLAILTTLCVGGVFMVLLSLLPTDRRAVRHVALFVIALAIFACAVSLGIAVDTVRTMISGECTLPGGTSMPCWALIGRAMSATTVFMLCLFFSILLGFGLCRGASSQLLLSQLWCLAGTWFASFGVFALLIAICNFATGQHDLGRSNTLDGIQALIFGILTLFSTSIRHRVQSWFMSRGESAVAAAGIAEMLGGRKVDDVLRCARNTFRYVPADRVLYDDLKDSKPNPELAALTQKGRLGLVDVFVSHSWHDDSDAKWARLQEFRQDFKLRFKREPNLWIDKYCIDQTNIDNSLACLPVYLSGCRKLLILCGKTYLDRLWCIVEILVFLEMQGQMEQLDVRLLIEGERKSSFRRQQEDALKGFDPRKAYCFTKFDTQRLHEVIEIFGYERITKLVQDVFMNSLV